MYRLSGQSLEDFNGETGKKELPVPGTSLIGSKGTVRLAHVDVDYTRRLDPDNVVGVLKTLKTAE